MEAGRITATHSTVELKPARPAITAVTTTQVTVLHMAHGQVFPTASIRERKNAPAVIAQLKNQLTKITTTTENATTAERFSD